MSDTNYIFTDSEKLQAYINEQKATYLSKPAYEVRFYSRFDSNSDIVNALRNISTTNTYDSTQSARTSKIPNLENTIPTLSLDSNFDLNTSSVPIITNIIVDNNCNVGGGGGGVSSQSQATIEIFEPQQGTSYFKQTIGFNKKNNNKNNTNQSSEGSSNPQTDYDYSPDELPGVPGAPGKQTDTHKIGTMDTVVIKLGYNNGDNNPALNNGLQVVFRGVISSIERIKSFGGSKITIHLVDFSEFMSEIIAMPVGPFSTENFNITGRGYVNNLINYTNYLNTGNEKWLNLNTGTAIDFAKTVGETIVAEYNSNEATQIVGSQIPTNSANINSTHKFYIPPFLFLEYSDIIDTNGLQKALTNPQTGQKYDQNSADFITLMASNIDWNSFNAQTPEDTESIETYKGFTKNSPDLSQYNRTQVAGTVNKYLGDARAWAWAHSDMWWQNGIQSFEQQKPWDVIGDIANTTLREAFIDFAPKLKPGAQYPFQTADVRTIKDNTPFIGTSGGDRYGTTNLADLHPNIGIVKYRLKPCFIPYLDNNIKTSMFKYFDITDDVILSYTSTEKEDQVSTAIFSFPTGTSSVDIGNVIKNNFQGRVASGSGGLATSVTTDQRLEFRLGYRFKTLVTPQKSIEFLQYLTSTATLATSQLSMFSQNVTVIGDPAYQPGSIVRINSQWIDYYCTSVHHEWNMDSGYTCSLGLEMGRTSGTLPAQLSYNEIDTTSLAKDIQCKNEADKLRNDLHISDSDNVGDVNILCLMKALWDYMTCGATDYDQLKAFAPINEVNQQPIKYTEWIQPYGGWTDNTKLYFRNSPGYYTTTAIINWSNGYVGKEWTIGQLKSLIEKYIKQYGLDAYNVTPNLIVNIIRLESNFIVNALNANDNPHGYGLYQNTSNISSQDNLPGNITGFSACTDFDKATQAAIYLLSTKYQIAGDSKTIGAGGIPWLQGLQAYNGGLNINVNAPGASEPYGSLVLGPTQFNAIKSGSQNPSGGSIAYLRATLSCATNSADTTQWPYDVYGPCGLRITQYQSVGLNSKDNRFSQTNNYFDWDKAMNATYTYLKNIANTYNNNPNANPFNTSAYSNNPFNNLTNAPLLDKIIAIWYSNGKIVDDEGIKGNVNLDTNKMKNVIAGVKALYNDCKICAFSDIPKFSAADKIEVNSKFGKYTFYAPIDNMQLTAPFGEQRTNPNHKHEGIDVVNANSNSAEYPVYAAARGVVTVAQANNPSAGNFIVLYHGSGDNDANLSAPSGISTRYMDLGPDLPTVGTIVKGGQPISFIPPQTSGPESGPHLHFEIRVGATKGNPDGGTPQDPVEILRTHNISI